MATSSSLLKNWRSAKKLNASLPQDLMTTTNLREWLSQARQKLAGLCDSPGLEAQVLAAHVLGQRRTWIAAHPETLLSADQQISMDALLARLQSGEPLPYITGHQEFYGLEFNVSPHVLIPRPETELLVEEALAWLRIHPGPRLAADVGAGSGCIAVSVAKNYPAIKFLALDLSMRALSVARSNIMLHQVDSRVQPIQSDLLSAAGGPFDMLCANLPYIPSGSLQDLPVFRWEPHQALDGGLDGFVLIRRLLEQAVTRMKPGGLLLLEIEASQGETAPMLGRGFFPRAEISIRNDFSGHPRILIIHPGK
jgi:release factor glutamine methyltransferase